MRNALAALTVLAGLAPATAEDLAGYRWERRPIHSATQQCVRVPALPTSGAVGEHEPSGYSCGSPS